MQDVTEVERYKIIAVRLKAARRQSGLNQQQVAEKVGQKGMTQVSLWEKGERPPKLMDLIKMSLIYKVPLDFIVGITDDPLGDAEENTHGFMTNMIVNAMNSNYLSWAAATAASTAALIKSNSQDRLDIIAIGKLARDARSAYERIKELNPGYEEDMRGASKLDGIMVQICDKAKEADERATGLIRQITQIEREMKIADGEMQRRLQSEIPVNVSQMILELQRTA